MLEPIGVKRDSIVTSLGRMVYYTPSEHPWLDETTRTEEGQSSIVFLHGFGGGSSAYEWSQVYPAFASDYRVLAPDLIGWGRSEHPKRNYQIEDYLTIIREFLTATCSEPVTVVASSLTAAFTIRVAVEHPELFKSLILVTPAGLSDFGEDYTRSIIARVISLPVVDNLLYWSAIATPDGIRNFLENRQFARPERIYPEIVDAYLESAKQENGEYAALSFVRGDLSFDLSLYLPQLTIPTAMIWGEKTQFTSVDLGKRLAALNPTAVQHLEILKDVGLTPQLELPAVTIGLIHRYLKLFTEDESR
ncbi:alpha/beta hydrolase fold protein [Halothece sp. PCC 7418]|uniref:alpha/beta fold hydrolase n=1 Tax=Halothece sp. (strain PCC 7418) TaxID=65093 RepID=UPI0002A06FC0|nr:alpha/beta hydrolase [Halothece sp. PCC 7418]AFZ43735.1 alpha/beta hydrolase fold protein [Halothece sp. PCC 7418]